MPKDAPPAVAKPKKRALKVLAVLVGFLALLVASFPWWSPWAARAAARSVEGLEIDRIEARGWDRWEARGVRYEADGVSVSAERASLPSPAALLWRRAGPIPLELEKWRVETRPGDSPPRERSEDAPGPAQIFDLAESYWEKAAGYGLTLGARSGVVVLEGREALRVEALEADGDSLRVEAFAPAADTPLALGLERSGEARAWTATIAAEGFETEATIRVERADDGLAADGSIALKGNRVEVRADWPESPDWIPTLARLSADAFPLHETVPEWPANLPLLATASAEWERGAYRFELAGLDPGADADAPGQIQLSGRGDLESLRIDAGRARLPWVSATLDAPLEIAYSLEDPLRDATAQLAVDLAEVPWVEGRGTLGVVLRTVARDDGLPEARLLVSSADAALYGIELVRLEGALSLVGRALSVESLEAQTAAGSRLSAAGEVDLDKRALSGARLSGALADEFQRLRDALPIGTWSNLDFDAVADGPLANPSFRGSARLANAQFPGLQPLGLGLAFDGGLSAFSAQLELSSPQAVVRLDANASVTPEASSFEILELAARYADGQAYDLQAPATLRFESADKRLTLSAFRLAGSGGSGLAVDALRLDAENFSARASLADLPAQAASAWLEEPLPELRAREASLALDFGAGRRHAETSGRVDGFVGQSGSGTPIELSWSAEQSDDEPQLSIESLAVSSQGRSILQARGALPLSLDWAERRFGYAIDESAPFEIALDSSPHPDFWAAAERFLPIAIMRPTIKAELSGTLAEPSGRAGVKLQSLRWRDPERPELTATLSDVDIVISALPNRLEATSISARLGGNRIQASGTLPLQEATLPEIIRRRAPPNLRDLTGAATVEVSDIAALELWLPEFVRSEGRARVELTLKPGSVEGVAELEGLSTRPLPPLGAISGIHGQLRFVNGRFAIERLAGRAERSPFTLTGQVDLSNPRAPRYDLAFRSDDFPIARDTGLLLSGDLDIRLRAPEPDEPPTISGKIVLSKGIFLVEPDLLSSSAKTSAKRPPYFSVEQEPFRQWGLDLAIEGEDFMRVSNSYFEGLLSADFRLEGTLQAPLLVGKATATEGRINFPATSLSLTSGELSITRDRPSEIQIDATANGRIYGYDANLVASGELSDPEVTVTTNPALTQIEALLLVTTGTLPSSEGGLASQSATTLGLFVGKGLFRRISGGGNSHAERLDVEVGRDISLQGKSTIEARYRLSDTLTVEGEYDERDEYNANLKWTFFEK